MTKFAKNQFDYHGGYLHYNTGTERKFVARFKHRGPVTKAKFLSTLIKHYSVEDYFAKMNAGAAPLQVLMNDGILVYDAAARKFSLDGKVL
jgi:hypothetical protein